MRTRRALIALVAVAALAALLFLAWRAQEERPDSETRVVDVVVKRYRFDPGTNAPLNVSSGETVVLRLTSTDVTHGFAIPDYGVNVEVPPGQTVEVRLTANRIGDFAIYCTVFCGTGHPEHRGTLHVA